MNAVTIGCRVNADESGQEESAVDYLWSHLSIFILAAEHLLASWPGLLDKVRICRTQRGRNSYRWLHYRRKLLLVPGGSSPPLLFQMLPYGNEKLNVIYIYCIRTYIYIYILILWIYIYRYTPSPASLYAPGIYTK